MKRLKYIIWILLFFVWVLYILPVGLLQVPYIQEKFSEKASEVLEEKLGVETKIGKVDFEFFNKLILKDLYLEDQAGDTLFQAKRLAAGFEFIPLLKGKLRFETIQLFSFQVNLNKENTESPLNLQFVIDAFANRDTTKKKSNIDLKIKTLNLRRGNFTYRIKDATSTPGIFNAKNLRVSDLSSKIHVKSWTKDSLIASFSHLSFSEQSGMEIQRIAFDLSATKYKAKISRLELKLPNSLLNIKDITADYSQALYPEEYLSKTTFNLDIEPSSILMGDLRAFIPAFSNFKDKISIKGNLSGKMESLLLQNFELQESNRMLIKANLQLLDINDRRNIFIRGRIDQSFISDESIRRIANSFSDKTIDLPPQINQLGDIRFEGEVSGYLHHLSTYGIFNTDIGTIRADINIGRENGLFIDGKIESDMLDMKKLMSDSNYGNTSFSIQVNAKEGANKKFSGEGNASIKQFEYKGYVYENLSMVGAFTPESFSGKLNLNTQDGNIKAEGLFALKGEHSKFNFYAEAENINLDKLNLSKKYKNSELSLNIRANFTGNNVDNILGNIDLTEIKFNTEKGKYYLDTFRVEANQEGNEKLLVLNSDIVNGEVRGMYSFTGIAPAINRLVSNYLPAIVPSQTKQKQENANNFSFEFTIEDTEELSSILKLPFVLFNKTKLVGQYNSIYDKFRLELYSPKLQYGKSAVESVMITADNSGNTLNLDINGVSLQKNNKKIKFSADIDARDNNVSSKLNWNSEVRNQYSGEFAFNTLFSKDRNKSPLRTNIEVLQTNTTFNDSIWTIHPASVVIDSAGIKINDLKINHDDQFILVDGKISKDPEEKIMVNLNKVDLEYVFTTINIPALEFGGIASGYVNAADLYHTRKLSTDLHVDGFSFNSTRFGDLTLEGIWDENKQGIIMKGNIFKNDTTKVLVDGIINPVKEELSIVFDARNADASFLRKYMKNIAKDVSGNLTGKLRLFGSLNDPTVEGDVFVSNGRFGIEFLNTYYTFSDSVHCRPDEIIIKDINFYDKNGWAALANGSVRHKLFEDFNYSATLVFDNFLVFNATERQNPYLYGTVYGTGSANIRGTENLVNIDVSMRNTKNTRLSLNFMEESDIGNYDFIHFVDKKADTTLLVEKYFSMASNKPIYLKSGEKTDIRFNLNLESTPEAVVDLIMDPITGDKIRTYGQGHLQVSYGTRIPLRMNGKYTIDRGKYNFSLQQVIFRDFDIREGSSVSFHGDPYTAILDIKAAYSVMANLSDLNPDLVQYAGRSSVMTNCVLDITGAMKHPDIKFDIEVPESDYIERQIKNHINTEDMMNRQMVYLLVLNRFYTPAEYVSTGNLQTNDLSMLASSTLSSSLSSIVNSFTDNIQVGTRIRTENPEAMTGTEVELMLSSQLLDNRLILNGNLGYRDYSYMKDDGQGLPPFVGDFDLEYKLTPGGGVRLKAYNHYNYRYYYLDSRSKTTQGLGVIFRKDFDRIDELFGRKKKYFTFPPDSSSNNFPKVNSGTDFIRFRKEE